MLRPTGRHGIHGCASAPHGEAQHRPRRTRYPRHARCGLSLFEAVLVMMIAVPLAQQGVRLAQHYIRAQAGVQESRLLTQVVTAASTYALRDLNNQIKNIVGVTRVRVLSLADLADVDVLVSTAGRTSLGRDIQIIFHAIGSKELVVLARAFTPDGEYTMPYMPRGGEGIGLVGTIQENAPYRLRGPGLDYNLTALQTQATAQDGISPPVVGDHLAIAVLRMDQDVLPYLHRITVPGHEEANQMETDLDMGKNNLVGVGALIADVITVKKAMDVGELTGTLEVVGNIAAGGDLDIPGTLESAEATIAGRIKATGLDVSGPAQLDTLEARSVLVMGGVVVKKSGEGPVAGVAVEGLIEAETLTATGNVVAGTVVAPIATIEELRAGTVQSKTLEVTDQLVTKKIVTGSCTGC